MRVSLGIGDMALTETQQARVTAINAALSKRGSGVMVGDARQALVDELGTLYLNFVEPRGLALAPEKQARLDETQEARAAELSAVLRKSGKDRVDGVERRAMVDELSTMLGAVEHTPAPLAPEKQARLDVINARLRNHAIGSSKDSFLSAIDRNALAQEAFDLCAEPAPPADGGSAA
jgi:hypothetical protein